MTIKKKRNKVGLEIEIKGLGKEGKDKKEERRRGWRGRLRLLTRPKNNNLKKKCKYILILQNSPQSVSLGF